MVRPDGSTLEAKIWAEQIDFDDVPCMLSCIVDVGDEKRREAQLLDLAHGMASHTGHAFFAELVQTMAKTMGADMVSVGELINGTMRSTRWPSGANGEPAAQFHLRPRRHPLPAGLWPAGAVRLPRSRSTRCFPTDLALAEGHFKAYVGQSLHDETGQTIGVLVALWHQPLANHVEVDRAHGHLRGPGQRRALAAPARPGGAEFQRNPGAAGSLQNCRACKSSTPNSTRSPIRFHTTSRRRCVPSTDSPSC